MAKVLKKKTVKKATVQAVDYRTAEAIRLTKELKEVVYQFAKKHTDKAGSMQPELASCVSAAILQLSINHYSIFLRNFKGSEVVEFLGQESLKIAEGVINRRGRTNE